MRIFLLALCFFFIFCNNILAQENKGEPKYVAPIVDNLLDGLNNNDYSKYTKNFSKQMREKITLTAFAQVQNMIQHKCGMYKSRKITKVQNNQGFIVVTYSAEFSKEKGVVVTASFKDKQLQGVWFTSPKLRGEVMGDKRKEILAYAEPMIDTVLKSLKNDNYGEYVKNFAESTKKQLTKGVFAQARQLILGKIGAYKSRKAVNVLKQRGYVIVVHVAEFEKEKVVKITTSFSNIGGKNLIVGHVLDSPKLRSK